MRKVCQALSSVEQSLLRWVGMHLCDGVRARSIKVTQALQSVYQLSALSGGLGTCLQAGALSWDT